MPHRRIRQMVAAKVAGSSSLLKAQDLVADASVAASAGLAAATWVADLAAWLQVVATLTAIMAALMATLWHYERWRLARSKRLDQETDDAV